MVQIGFLENPKTGAKIIDRGDERIALLPVEFVKSVGRGTESPAVMLLKIYRAVVPEFDDVNSINPAMIFGAESEVLDLLAVLKAASYANFEQVNLAWMNSGFSVRESLAVEDKIGPVDGYYRVFYRKSEALGWNGPGGGGDGRG